MAGEEDEDLESVLEEDDSVTASGASISGGHYNQQNHNIHNNLSDYQGQSQAQTNGNDGHSLYNSPSHNHNHNNHHGKSNGNSRKSSSGSGTGEMNYNHKKPIGLVDLVDNNVDYEAGSSGNNNGRGSGRASRGRQRQTGICDVIEAQLEHLGKGTTWLAIFLGQVLSGVLCISAIINVYLTDIYNIHVPNALNFAFYMTLATIFTTILACRPADRNLFPVLKTRGWKYALVAFADAEANFLVVKAYQFTTLTSVQLLDCFSIPTVLALSWLILRIRYKVAHILGVSICLLGVSCLVWADLEEGFKIGQGKDRFLGDMLVLGGAFLYGVSNVAQEFVVKTFDIVEFLGMVGLFGSFVSGAQTVLLEYEELTSAEWGGITGAPVLLILGYTINLIVFYVLAALVMKLSGATLYNLSILTADFYSLIVGIYLFQYKVHFLIFLSFVLTMTGVIVFSIKPTVIASHIYRSLTREHTTTVDLELMASTPPPTCPYSSESGFPGGNGPTLGMPGSLLDSSPTGCIGDSSFLSSQSCDVVMQTGAGVNHARRSDRYKDTKQMYETNGTYVIPEDEIC